MSICTFLASDWPLPSVAPSKPYPLEINLDDNTKQNIKNRLSGKLQKQVNVDWSINPDIIAGLVFIVGDSIIDTSMKSKLQMIGRNIIK